MNKFVIAAIATTVLCLPAMAAQQQSRNAYAQAQDQSGSAGQQAQPSRKGKELRERQLPVRSISARRVTQVQQALSSMGFKVGMANGRWRAKWEAALKQFQATHGLLSTGMLNKETLASLSLNPSNFGM